MVYTAGQMIDTATVINSETADFHAETKRKAG